MQFFDLSRQFNLSNILTPYKTLEDLARQEWFLSKVRVEHDCLIDNDMVEGQVVLKSVQFGYFDWILKRLALQPCHCHSSSHAQHALYLETILVEQDLLVFCKGLKYY